MGGYEKKAEEDGQMWVSVIMCLVMSRCGDPSARLGCPQVTLPRVYFCSTPSGSLCVGGGSA